MGKRLGAGRVLGVAAIVVGCLLFSGIAGAAAYFWPAAITALRDTGQVSRTRATPGTSASPSPAASARLSSGSPFTVLLLGSDDDTKFQSDHVLTQSMILVRVVPTTRQVTMLSIPRDLWVPLSSGGSAKIDAAYAHGGAGAAIATVERNFHVHVDDFVWIGLHGLVKLVDSVGGVDINATHPVLDDYYPADLGSNAFAYLRVAVLPGPQHLDGVHALQYVRSRHGDLAGDFARSQRQQQLLLAVKTKMRTLNSSDLPELVSAFSGELRTSISLTRIGDLFALAQFFNDPSAVHQVVLLPPYTTEAVIDGQDALVPNWELILPRVRQIFG
jgi:LCP family protein required for cell wall assembly